MDIEQKAKELVDKFYSSIPLDGFKGTYLTFRQHAKQCALIAVDEILQALREFKKGKMFTDSTHIGPTFNFWKAVKQEIENL